MTNGVLPHASFHLSHACPDRVRNLYWLCAEHHGPICAVACAARRLTTVAPFAAQRRPQPLPTLALRFHVCGGAGHVAISGAARSLIFMTKQFRSVAMAGRNGYAALVKQRASGTTKRRRLDDY